MLLKCFLEKPLFKYYGWTPKYYSEIYHRIYALHFQSTVTESSTSFWGHKSFWSKKLNQTIYQVVAKAPPYQIWAPLLQDSLVSSTWTYLTTKCIAGSNKKYNGFPFILDESPLFLLLNFFASSFSLCHAK